ncbi:MAG: LptF/LptG family permease [Parvularculaceae bacterium]|nr:LptF/LptG family permease [Parvularculaceae bacterium]
MKSLERYILRQMWTPFVFATVVVTAIVWLTQSLQRIELLVEHGASLALFGWLTMLIVPSLLAVVIPFALFGAALYALQRLHADSEIAVMFAAGVSLLQVARPVLLIAGVAAAATLWINIDLMPRSYRILKAGIADLRADVASAVLRPGEFMAIREGFTIYVDDAQPGGALTGLLVHDYRKSDITVTYLAQRALLKETDAGPVIFLVNGNVQRTDRKTGAVDIVNFDRTGINLGAASSPRDLLLEMTERYPRELFNPDLTNAYDRENAARLIAEGHNRYAGPLYAFAYALLAIFALIGGPYNRRGYVIRIALACAAAGAVKVIGIVLTGLAADTELYWIIYAPPAATILAALTLLAVAGPGARLAPASAHGVA